MLPSLFDHFLKRTRPTDRRRCRRCGRVERVSRRPRWVPYRGLIVPRLAVYPVDLTPLELPESCGCCAACVACPSKALGDTLTITVFPPFSAPSYSCDIIGGGPWSRDPSAMNTGGVCCDGSTPASPGENWDFAFRCDTGPFPFRLSAERFICVNNVTVGGANICFMETSVGSGVVDLIGSGTCDPFEITFVGYCVGVGTEWTFIITE